MKPKKVHLTVNGINDLQTELNNLKEVKRPKLVDRLSHAREQGDLSENSDYISAREELSFMDDRISEIEEALSNAQVVHAKSGDSIGIGSRVVLKIANKKNELTYNIVGDMEADPKQNKISLSSPIGMAIGGKKSGEVAQVKAPSGMVEYHIVSVE